MPKHIQQTLMGIFAALALGSFLFFSYRALGSSPGVQDIAGLIVTSVAILLLHRLEGLKGTLENIGDTLLGKLAKIEAYQAAVSSASTSVSYAGIESPVESQRERLRRECELILVHGAASVIANRPGQAREVADGIKAFLDELEVGAEDQTQAGDSLACKGINCGCTDGQSHSNECIVEAAMIQGWAGDKEARDAFAAIQSKTFASRAATESVATQPAASPTPVDDAIEAEIQAKGKTAQKPAQ